ncbi:YcdB/YcdC domain-containing protein [Paenibacillus radicis (ex Xue et al. 2023)]|uniref:YcdB/YcdC repeated domain-containing protein n=1 Tax=Paenibacillus radicis (ex Xue et al. 2023) TaxID=2972489 RepID=A0ABT1YCW2_9BACL|nr:YcdB/YcdC domain-containing protein [Paenibacillus radicis (ex Xue et al. 2023)]MCR8630605.1 hypothetical protein [Paenibacillus radicis (ex Xue et al. 2023)]
MKKSLTISCSLAAVLCVGNSIPPAIPLAFAASEPSSSSAVADDVHTDLRLSGELTLIGSEQLYDRPAMSAGTGLFLTPQTIAPLGFSTETGFYLISTWLGDKWIRPSEGVLEGIEPVEQVIVPYAPVYLFDVPLLGLNSGETASGPLHVFEKWRGWYHIHTDDGDKWIHFSYALPERLRPSKEPVSLPNGATLYRYPYGLSGEVGVIAPQTVIPVEQGDEWVHLRGDFGDGWVYLHQKENEAPGDDSVSVDKAKAADLARQRLGLSDEYTLESVRLVQLGDEQKRWNIVFHKKQEGFTIGLADITLNAANGSIDWYIRQESASMPELSEKAQDRTAVKQLVESFIAGKPPAANAEWMLDETPTNPLHNSRNRMDPALSFRYVRTVNGLPYPENHITVNINPSQNEVSYSLVWNENKRFDAPAGLMSTEEAELAFANAFLSNAVYRAPEDSKGNISPVYAVVPRIYDTLDAKKGQWRSGSGSITVRGPVTTQPLVDMPTESLNLSLDQAVDSARKKLGLPEYVSAENVSQGIFSWIFQLNVSAQDVDQTRSYYVEVSNITGDILQYSASSDSDGAFTWLTVPYISEAQAEAVAEQALRQLLPSYTYQLYRIRSELRLTDGLVNSNPEYLFTYWRSIDGIWADRQELTISVSAVNGQWSRLQSQLTPLIYAQNRPTFISKEAVWKQMFTRYRVEACYMNDGVLLTSPSTSIHYRLVPTTESSYASLLDAQTGVWRHFYTLQPE